MFTDRFIELPTKEYDIKHKELTGNDGELRDSFEKFLPLEIASYRTAFDNDEECVAVKLKNSEGFLIYLTIDEFENRLNNHQKQ